jgi:hypothetical protein
VPLAEGMTAIGDGVGRVGHASIFSIFHLILHYGILSVILSLSFLNLSGILLMLYCAIPL